MQEALTEERLPEYLIRIGLTVPGDRVHVEAAGDGNINWVRRVRRRRGNVSWIVKQARPALERFPEYRAPTERIVCEARFYEQTRALPEARVCPRIVAFDEEQRVLVMEDFGNAPRLDVVLAQGGDARDALVPLATFLAAAHAATAGADLAALFPNDGMRALHGEHIFRLPFRENGFPLPAAVEERARRIQADAELREIADTAHRRYLEPRGALVHADVQAGNVLLTAGGPKLLDAEIAHVGDPAFDVGTLLAHVALPAIAARVEGRAGAAAEIIWKHYTAARGADAPRFEDVVRYAAIEMLRRTIGAARVPVVEPPAAALAIIDWAEPRMRQPPQRAEDLE